MNNIETAIVKATKAAKRDATTYYVHATYHKVCIGRRPPPFGAAHWVVTADGFTRIEDEFTRAKLAAGL